MEEKELPKFIGRYTLVKKIGKTLYCPVEKSRNYHELCGDVDVYRNYINILTNEVKTHIRYWVNNQYNDLIIERKDLTKSGLISVLPSRGIQITENTVGILLDYLLYREKLAKNCYVHDRIGFAVIKGERVFLHHTSHSVSGEIRSRYCGGLLLKPKGTMEGELDFIRKEILGNYALECSWAIGFTASVLYILREKIALENCIYHMYGRSSSGKTSTSLICISPWTIPSKSVPKGLFSTWASTENAITGKLSNLMGVPIVFDEAGMIDSKVYSRVVYQAASGIEKSRLSGDFSVRDPKSWTAIVVSTGENPLVSNQNRNAGLRMRVLQFANVEWTKSASSSSRITEGLLKNYGNTGVAFAKSLLAFPEEDLLSRFKEAEEYVLKKMPIKDALSSRGAQKIAIIYLTSLLLNEAFDIGLDSEEILKFLVASDMDQILDRNLGFQAYQAVKESVVSNLNRFVVRNGLASRQMFAHQPGHDELPRGDIYGRIEHDDDMKISKVLILRNRLDKILQSSGFVEPDIVLSEWRDKGIIDTDAGKFTKKRTLYTNSSPLRVVVLKMSNHEYEKMDGGDEKEELPKKKSNRLKSHEIELIDDDDIVIV